MEKNNEYKDVGKDVKEFLFKFNKDFIKITRKKKETDEQFLKRIEKERDKYLKNVHKCETIELKGGKKINKENGRKEKTTNKS